MNVLINVFKLTAGVGLFVFGMNLLEGSIKDLSGREFKIFLQRITKNRISAASGGVVVSAILQSSSLVSLMVLAFVGAGVFTLKNALAMILGANLGTTVTNWLVVALGFKVDMEIAAYPSICLGGIMFILFNNKKAIKEISFFFFGFGLLFIAISFIKQAMESQVGTFSFEDYKEMPLVTFLLIGFLITVIVQSSTITMALVLSALHLSVINFTSAAIIVLGSEIGTTIKIVLGSMGGVSNKKQVAVGNLLFNLLLAFFVFFFLNPLLFFITDVLKIKDSLIALVTFSSVINFISILMFLPFIDSFANFLEFLFKDSTPVASAFISDINKDNKRSILSLFKKEVAYFIHNGLLFNLSLFDSKCIISHNHDEFEALNKKRNFTTKTQEEKYIYMKQWQGEIQAFFIKYKQELKPDEAEKFMKLNSAVRSVMYSVKSLKDVWLNLNNLRRSSKDIKFNFLMARKKEIESLYGQVNEFLSEEVSSNSAHKTLPQLLNMIEQQYELALNDFYKQAKDVSIDYSDITTVINFNRELFSSNKAMLMALQDFSITEKEPLVLIETHVY